MIFISCEVYPEQHRDQVRPAPKCLIVIVAVVLPYQALYVHCIDQIQYLFEDRLSDKLYFRIFTHVVGCSLKQNYNMKGKPPGSTLLLYF